jgi:hypothetical protein
VLMAPRTTVPGFASKPELTAGGSFRSMIAAGNSACDPWHGSCVALPHRDQHCEADHEKGSS